MIAVNSFPCFLSFFCLSWKILTIARCAAVHSRVEWLAERSKLRSVLLPLGATDYFVRSTSHIPLASQSIVQKNVYIVSSGREEL